MGYWSDHKRSDKTMREWAAAKYDYENAEFKHEVIETGLVNRTTLFIACKRSVKNDPSVSYVYCMVVLIRWIKDNHYNMMIKELDETICPSYYNCPVKVFKSLTPLTDDIDFGSAGIWREHVQEYHTARNLLKTVKVDDVIQLKSALLFNGVEVDSLQVYNKRRLLFIPKIKCGYGVVKISKDLLLSIGYDVIS